ncbi:MAG: FKBP-type peptidyl-prolyl cis-trans isomerase [Acidimicrobiia bacterium]
MRRFGVTLLVGLFALAGTALPAGAATSDLADVTVTGAPGEKPTLEFEKPFEVTKSTSREITPGTGEKLVKGDKITFDFVAVDGRTGEELESSFGGSSPSFVLDKQQSVKGLVSAIVGTTVGSRVLVAIAPKEGVAKGLTSPTVKKSDTLLFVVDVRSVRTPLERATGEPVVPAAGLPTVTLGGKGKPTIKVPKTDPPTQLVVQPLVKGTGPVVEAGQNITVHYTGVIWRTGKQFDSSWKSGTPIDTPIGAGQVIPGWDEALVGQTVGSQLLLVVPPDKAYGAQGNANAGISGTDTLVFVVDILDAF